MKKCKGCVRFEKREFGMDGYHCCRQHYDIDKFPDDDACEMYWDRQTHEEEERQRNERQEQERQRRWKLNENNKPVKLPIIFDGYGNIPQCPNCGEMPYSTEQCHWCGQKFIQDEEIEEYNTPNKVELKCFRCGGRLLELEANTTDTSMGSA